MAEAIAWALYLVGAAAVLSAMFSWREPWPDRLIALGIAFGWPPLALVIVAGRIRRAVRGG